MAISIKALTESIIKHRGNVSAVARAHDVPRSTVASRITKSDTLKKIVQEARDTVLDDAEDMLYERMKESDTLLIFYLKTQGKKRGYIERQELTGEDGKPVPISVVNFKTHEDSE